MTYLEGFSKQGRFENNAWLRDPETVASGFGVSCGQMYGRSTENVGGKTKNAADQLIENSKVARPH